MGSPDPNEVLGKSQTVGGTAPSELLLLEPRQGSAGNLGNRAAGLPRGAAVRRVAYPRNRFHKIWEVWPNFSTKFGPFPVISAPIFAKKSSFSRFFRYLQILLADRSKIGNRTLGNIVPDEPFHVHFFGNPDLFVFNPSMMSRDLC